MIGYVTESDKCYKRITYVKPVKHTYDEGVKYSCPVCDALGNKHQVTIGDAHCPLCNVNLIWKEKVMPHQNHTSKNTSINSSKLPSIYNHINYHQLIWEAYDKAHKGTDYLHRPIILDYGAGKHTDHIRKFLDEKYIDYRAYDPYNGSDEDWNTIKPDLIVCSNVLNVIDSDEAMKAVHDYVSSQGVPYLITVYEGNKTGVGVSTKKDCYQRNAKTATYKHDDEIVYKSVITKPEYKDYVK